MLPDGTHPAMIFILLIRNAQCCIQTSTRLIKDLIAIFTSCPDGVAVLLAVTRFLLQQLTTTTFAFFRAYWTLNKQQVAATIFTVGMAVARRAALRGNAR